MASTNLASGTIAPLNQMLKLEKLKTPMLEARINRFYILYRGFHVTWHERINGDRYIDLVNEEDVSTEIDAVSGASFEEMQEVAKAWIDRWHRLNSEERNPEIVSIPLTDENHNSIFKQLEPALLEILAISERHQVPYIVEYPPDERGRISTVIATSGTPKEIVAALKNYALELALTQRAQEPPNIPSAPRPEAQNGDRIPSPKD